MSTTPFYKQYTIRGCAVCGSTTNKLLFRQTFSEMSSGSLLKGYDVVVCEACGFGFADHIPSQNEFDEHYRDMSKYEYQDQGGKETEYDLDRFRAITDSIIPLFSDSRACFLDVGCATGRLLALFKEKGYDNVIGLDPSPLCSRSAQRLYGVRVVTGTIYDTDKVLADEQPFDCIIMAGVLEHIRGIHQALLRIRKLLAKGGFIFIEVPDATDFARWPDAPFQEFSTEHINFFSDTSLENLMCQHGFSQVFSHKATRDQTISTVMPVVTAMFRKKDNTQPAMVVRDIETEKGLRDYIQKSQDVENSIQQIIDEIVRQTKPIIIWGVGTHTLHLLTTSRLRQANIRAFVDSNPRYQGKQLNGHPIIAPGELRNRSETVLISSRVFQSAIEQQMREDLKLNNEIIKLYET